ncbi:MAG TPA: hypothetical protein VF088_03000 [Pyrinomonadaceae bacterium]
MTDYAWIPPDRDKDYEVLRAVVTLRPNTTLWPGQKTSVKAFLEDLVTTGTVAKPVGGLIVGSHASSEDWIAAHFADEQKDDTGYAEVTRVFNSRRAAFLIPTALYQNANPPVKLRIIGCEAGRAPEMLRKLKEVMGNNVPIVGCRFHYLVRTVEQHGGFITFTYPFDVFSPTQLSRKQQLIDLLKARATAQPNLFKFLDGTPIPPEQWAKWVPEDAGLNKSQFKYGKKDVPLGQTLKAISKLPAEFELWYLLRKVTRRVPNMPTPANTPAGLTAGIAALKTKLPAELPEFDPAHEYPFFRQRGCVDINEFVDSFNWKFEKDGTNTICRGQRHDYTLYVPVKFPEAGKTWDQQRMLFHFYPAPGSGLPLVSGDFTDDDARIWVTV